MSRVETRSNNRMETSRPEWLDQLKFYQEKAMNNSSDLSDSELAEATILFKRYKNYIKEIIIENKKKKRYEARVDAVRVKREKKGKKKELILKQKRIARNFINNASQSEIFLELDKIMKHNFGYWYPEYDNTLNNRKIVFDKINIADKNGILIDDWNKKNILSIPEKFLQYDNV